MTPMQAYLQKEYPRILLEISGDNPERNIIADLEKEISARQYPQWRSTFVSLALRQATLTHLGYPLLSSTELLSLFSHTVDETVEHFSGDWWTRSNVTAWIEQYGQHFTDLERMQYSNGCWPMDPNCSRERPLERYEVSGAILTAVFMNRLEDLAKICGWFDLRVIPSKSYPERRCEDEYEMGILYLISRLRREAIPGIDKLVAKIERRRHKRPKVFVRLINSVFDGDLQAYHELLPIALSLHFEDYPIMHLAHLVAYEESALAEYARQKGMEPPPLEGRAKFALMTPFTLGFLE